MPQQTGRTLNLTFDLLNFDPADSPTTPLYLDNVKVQKYSLP
jgi:hypothetical protein